MFSCPSTISYITHFFTFNIIFNQNICGLVTLHMLNVYASNNEDPISTSGISQLA